MVIINEERNYQELKGSVKMMNRSDAKKSICLKKVKK